MAPSAQTTLHDQEISLPKRQLIVVIVTLGAILFVINIDHNGISTILPTVAEDLKGQKTISWAGSSALIATTVFSVQYGRLSDIFGRTAMFINALSVFAVAELFCGFAVNPPMLYALRAVTGASGGGIGNLVMIITSDLVPLRQRGQYQAILGPFMVLGNVVGPLIAAGFAGRLTWRGFFWLLAPLGFVCAISAAWLLPSTKPTDSFRTNIAKIDWLGSLTSIIAIVFFMIPISGGGLYYRWDSPMVIGMLSISGAALMVFLFVEWKVACLPIIPLSMFAIRDVCALLAQTFALGWINQTNIYFFPIYAQNLRGWSPITSGALLLPIIAVQVIVSVLAGRWMSKGGHYGGVIRLGIIFLFIGSSLEITFDESTSPVAIIFILLAIGIGVGSANQPMVVAMQAHTKKSQRAVVTSCRNFFRFFGSACGVAVSAAVHQSTLKSALPEEHEKSAELTYSLEELDQSTWGAVAPAHQAAIRNVFITSAAVSTMCVLCLLLWRDNGYEPRPEDEEDGVSTARSASPTEEDGIKPGRGDHSYGTITNGEPVESNQARPRSLLD